MSDDDSDVPALVPSSDEEEEHKVVKKIDECVDIWLSKNVKFLEKQEHNVRIFSLGPFMIGLETFLAKPWLFCLYDSKLLIQKVYEEKTEYTKFTDEEWQNLDVVHVVTKLIVRKMRKKKFLVKTLEMIDNIEVLNRGDGIDVKHAIQTAARYPHISETVWEKALSMPYMRNKEQKVKFASLYLCKLCHMIITSLAREGKDISEDFKKYIRGKCGGYEKAIAYKDKGNQHYSQQKFVEAVKMYTEAIQSDPFNHLCYGNRAQAYQKVNKHHEALADGRRAVLMKPDWIKGYYRYAQAFYHTNRIDMAIAINKKGMKICEKTKNNDKMLSELKDQGNKLQAEKDGETADHALKEIMKTEAYKCSRDEIPEEIRDVPGCTGVIHLESALQRWSKTRHNQDASVLVSSEDEDSSEEETPSLSYSEARKIVLESKKQTKDPEVETLTLNKNQGKKKSRKGNQTSNKQSKASAEHSTPLVKQPLTVPTPEKTVKENIVVVHKNENKEIERYMAEGSSAYLNGLGKKAVASYQKALDLLNNKKPEEFGLDEQDVAVLEYAYGVSEISTGIYKHILEGIDRLKNITETYKDTRLPLPYLGIAKAYITLNRFEEAVEPLSRCLRMAGTLKLNVLTWPGTDTKMEESMSDELQKKVKELMTLTKYPPPPDAICKLHTDKEDSRVVIFFSDPDFKGFVRIVCLTSCIIEFHNQCWKDFKSKYGEKTCDKDILEKPCPTPDCKSCIVKIIIFRQDSLQKEIVAEKAVEYNLQKPKKPSLKLPPSSQEKIDKKKEKKELKKQRKRELKEESDDLMDNMDNVAPVSKENKERKVEPEVIDLVPGVDDYLPHKTAKVEEVKKEEEYKSSKPKAPKKKNKKKKDKGKQVLNVEVNFGDENEKQLFGEDDVVEEENEQKLVSSTVPKEQDINKTNGAKKPFIPKAETSTSQFDEIEQNLFLFFEDLFEAHGPLHIHDAKITSMVDDFPTDAKDKIDRAGGLSKFLLQSKKFAMLGEVICNTKDAHKASKISRQQSESFASKASKLKSSSDNNQSAIRKQENVWTNGSKNGNNPTVKSENRNNETPSKVDFEPEFEKANSKLEKTNSKTLKGDKGSKVSCMDTLDDFDYPVEKPNSYPIKTVDKTIDYPIKTVEKTMDYPNNPPEKTKEKSKPVERSVSMDMDAIDDIDLIPVTRKSKKKKKNKRIDDLDDFDWNISDSESFKESTGISDLDNISSREESSKIVGKEKMDLKKLDRKFEKSNVKTEITMSRSSSKSDLSERSDFSAELKTAKQKMPDFKLTPSSKSMWPTRERTLNSSPNNFGPIGSPVPSEKTEQRNESSDSYLSYSSYSNDKSGSILLMDTEKAAEREKYRIDSQYVQELTDQVMNEMTFGKNLTDPERTDLRRQVSQDIWTDFKRTANKYDTWTSKANDIGYEYTTNKKSYTEEYMKNFYQKKNTDPNLNSESFAAVTSNSFFYGDSTFSNNISTTDSGWPKSVSESLGYPSFQSSLATTQSSFSTMTTNLNSFTSLSPATSIFSPLPTKSSDFQSPFSLPTTKTDIFGNWSIGVSVTATTTDFSTSSQPLNTFPGNYTSVFSNDFQKFHVDKSAHAVVETCTVSVNTDPYEPLKEEFQRMKKEYNLLQGDLTSALTQKQELVSHLHELTHRLKTIELDVSIKNDAIGKERQSLQEKHDLLYLEKNHLNQQLTKYAENEKDLKVKINKLEEELKQKSKERQDLKFAEDEVKKREGEYKIACDKEKERAARAEVEVVNLRKLAAVNMLERSKKEAMYHVHKLKGFHKQHEDQGKDLPTQMKQAMSYYENIVAKCSETVPILVNNFDEQITQIQNGRCLSDLSQVFVPPPPPAFTPTSQGVETKLLNDEIFSKPSKSSTVEPSSSKTPNSSSGLTPISVKGPTSHSSVSLATQPRPLVPPPGLQTQSVRQQIPRLANNPGQTNGQNTHKLNSFEKLIKRLTVSFPQYNRAIFIQLIQQLRQTRGGSLSGLTIDEITQQLTAMVQAHEQKQSNSQTSTVPSAAKPPFPGTGPSKPVGPPPGLSSSWGFNDTSNSTSTYKGEEVFEEEQDPCVICHEEMTVDTTVKLECHHRFHDECIRKWLKENSTCPNCRIYALLPDEFPTLG